MKRTNIVLSALLFAIVVAVSGQSVCENVLLAVDARIRSNGGAVENAWNLWGNGVLGDWFEVEEAGRVELVFKMAGEPAKGVYPEAIVRAEEPGGACVLSKRLSVDSDEYREYRFDFESQEVVLRIEIEFLNDYAGGGEDRNILIEEVRVAGAKLLEDMPRVEIDTDDEIGKYRMGTLIVETKPGAVVRVNQIKHEFEFGTAISHSLFTDQFSRTDREKYFEILKSNFNAVVTENSLKWHSVEPSEGLYRWERVDELLEWAEGNGLPVRGHCIFWASPNRVQDWVKELDDRELLSAVRRRAREVTSRYRGRIKEYDLNNEMLFERYYRERLGDGVVKEMADSAKEGDPDAVLYLNQWGILSGNAVDRYVAQIQGFLDQGVPVGGIGCQGHFGARMDLQKIMSDLDKLARFELPIKVSEFDVNTSNEEQKAMLLEAFYRLCFGHPSVRGIYVWGFWEGRHWRPRAALWKKDWTPNPSAEVYRRLVYDEWWTAFEGKADSTGRCRVPAFYGSHTVEVDGEKMRVDLKKGEGPVEISIGL
jgi:endo-1,4-beta-xylanase